MIARYRKAMEDKEKGFTLVELLVVIIIIGILAAIAVPVYLNQQAKAKDSAVKSDLGNAKIAVATALVDSPDAGSVVLGDTDTTSATAPEVDFTWSGNTKTVNGTTIPGDVTVTISGGEFTITAVSTTGKSFKVDESGGIVDVSTTGGSTGN